MLEKWLPQALPLRRAATTPTAAPVAKATQDWDRAIFDPARLSESFGSFNAIARQLLQDFVADAAERIAVIVTAAQTGDVQAVRGPAHALKGGALSVGATRLGNIASDLQDACDANDTTMMQLMAELLAPTLDELRELLPVILQHEDTAA
jgi:HPt (histidine-containing phosphotransfer) domain-containing protein